MNFRDGFVGICSDTWFSVKYIKSCFSFGAFSLLPSALLIIAIIRPSFTLFLTSLFLSAILARHLFTFKNLNPILHNLVDDDLLSKAPEHIKTDISRIIKLSLDNYCKEVFMTWFKIFLIISILGFGFHGISYFYPDTSTTLSPLIQAGAVFCSTYGFARYANLFFAEITKSNLKDLPTVVLTRAIAEYNNNLQSSITNQG